MGWKYLLLIEQTKLETFHFDSNDREIKMETKLETEDGKMEISMIGWKHWKDRIWILEMEDGKMETEDEIDFDRRFFLV